MREFRRVWKSLEELGRLWRSLREFSGVTKSLEDFGSPPRLRPTDWERDPERWAVPKGQSRSYQYVLIVWNLLPSQDISLKYGVTFPYHMLLRADEIERTTFHALQPLGMTVGHIERALAKAVAKFCKRNEVSIIKTHFSRCLTRIDDNVNKYDLLINIF